MTTGPLLVFAAILVDIRSGLRVIGAQDLAHDSLLRLLLGPHRVVDMRAYLGRHRHRSLFLGCMDLHLITSQPCEGMS